MDIKVFDDFLPEYIQDNLYNFCIDGKINFKYFKQTLKGYEDYQHEEYEDGEQFASDVLGDGLSHYFLLPLQIASLMDGFEFESKNIYRSKINFKLKVDTNKKKFINPPHRDHNFENGVIGIYYLNDSDGDTIIYEGEDVNNLKIMKKVSPKKGRLLLMNSGLYHAASHPVKTEKRLIINYNLIF